MKTIAKVAGFIAAVAAIATGVGAALGGTMMLTVFGGAGIAASTIASVAGAISVGASLLIGGPKTVQSSPENYQRLRASIDPRTARKTVVGGPTAFATDIRDEEFTSGQEFFHRFIVCASHKVHSFEEIWFDDKRVWTAADGVVGEFDDYLTVTTRTEGSAANAINISSRMGSTRRFTGLAYVYLRYKLTGKDKEAESPFAQSITTRITIKGKGATLPDPRDPAQDMADQSTWVWDDDACRNPALVLLFYLLGYRITNPVTGVPMLAVGKGIPANRIDLESFAIAANICDEPVAKIGGGTEPRYRCDGVWSEADSPTTVIDMLKATMNADLDDVGGKLRLTIFHDDLADVVTTFTDDDILDGFEWQAIPTLDQTYNIVQGAYTDPSNDSLYQQVDYPLQQTDSPDGIDRINTFNLPMVQSAGQAQRLAAMRLERQNYGGVFRAEFQATAWKVQKNSIVRLTFAQTGFVDKLFRVAEIEIRQDGVVPLTLVEENAAIYDPPSLEEALAPVPSTPYDPALNPWLQTLNSTTELLISTSWVTDADPADGLVQATAPGGVVSIEVEDHTRNYSDKGAVAVTGATLTTDEDGDPLAVSTKYFISYDDPGRAGGAVTYTAYLTSGAAILSATAQARHYVSTITTPASGGSSNGSPGSVPPGWEPDDFCVTTDTPILMANNALDGPGEAKAMGEIKPGEFVWTRHEKTLECGAYRVTHIEIVKRDVVEADGYPRATSGHRFRVGDDWRRAGNIGTPAGRAPVGKITVEHARTYQSQAPDGTWVESHNAKA